MKPNDIIMIFTDPLECKLEEGQAFLIEKLPEVCGDPELWDVQFLDCPDKIYQRLIKKI